MPTPDAQSPNSFFSGLFATRPLVPLRGLSGPLCWRSRAAMGGYTSSGWLYHPSPAPRRSYAPWTKTRFQRFMVSPARAGWRRRRHAADGNFLSFQDGRSAVPGFADAAQGHGLPGVESQHQGVAFELFNFQQRGEAPMLPSKMRRFFVMNQSQDPSALSFSSSGGRFG